MREGTSLNFWAAKYMRPLLVPMGMNSQADALLAKMGCKSALVYRCS